MLDLIIFMVSDGPNTNSNILLQTIFSIKNTVGKVNYKFYLVLNQKQEQAVSQKLQSGELCDKNILEIRRSSGSWANQFNVFLSKHGQSARYVLISHDDLVIKTNDFFSNTMDLLGNREGEVGWITYTSDFYYRDLGRPWSVSVRPGFFKDRGNWPCLFECHQFKKSHDGHANKHLDLLDMPKPNRLVKAHAVYTDLTLISAGSLEKVGFCEDWSPYTMLTDENWGLEALKNNLWNVWISNIYYTHPTNYHSRTKGNRYLDQAQKKFTEKWGFAHGGSMHLPETVKMIREKYKNTLIPWSSYYVSYDWQYL